MQIVQSSNEGGRPIVQFVFFFLHFCIFVILRAKRYIEERVHHSAAIAMTQL